MTKKKLYEKPTIEVVQVQMTQMLAASMTVGTNAVPEEEWDQL